MTKDDNNYAYISILFNLKTNFTPVSDKDNLIN